MHGSTAYTTLQTPFTLLKAIHINFKKQRQNRRMEASAKIFKSGIYLCAFPFAFLKFIYLLFNSLALLIHLLENLANRNDSSNLKALGLGTIRPENYISLGGIY